MQMDETHARWKGGSATDRLFIIAVIVKGIDGVLGMAGGLLLHFAEQQKRSAKHFASSAVAAVIPMILALIDAPRA